MRVDACASDRNADFMRAADILVMSDEALPPSPEEWAGAVLARYGNRIVVIGLGVQGALLAVNGETPLRRPAVFTRSVVNTIGAGMHYSPVFFTNPANRGMRSWQYENQSSSRRSRLGNAVEQLASWLNAA